MYFHDLRHDVRENTARIQQTNEASLIVKITIKTHTTRKPILVQIKDLPDMKTMLKAIEFMNERTSVNVVLHTDLLSFRRHWSTFCSKPHVSNHILEILPTTANHNCWTALNILQVSIFFKSLCACKFPYSEYARIPPLLGVTTAMNADQNGVLPPLVRCFFPNISGIRNGILNTRLAPINDVATQ